MINEDWFFGPDGPIEKITRLAQAVEDLQEAVKRSHQIEIDKLGAAVLCNCKVCNI